MTVYYREQEKRTTEPAGTKIKRSGTNPQTKYEKQKNLTISRLLDNRSMNPQKFWNKFKSIFPTKTETSNAKERVTSFAKYFINVVKRMKIAGMLLTNFIWRKKTTLN